MWNFLKLSLSIYVCFAILIVQEFYFSCPQVPKNWNENVLWSPFLPRHCNFYGISYEVLWITGHKHPETSVELSLLWSSLDEICMSSTHILLWIYLSISSQICLMFLQVDSLAHLTFSSEWSIWGNIYLALCRRTPISCTNWLEFSVMPAWESYCELRCPHVQERKRG